MNDDNLDLTDRQMLRILSLYENLNPLELWYELGEMSHPAPRLTNEEIVTRLESLRSQGVVEKIPGSGNPDRGFSQSRYRLRANPWDMTSRSMPE